MKKINVEWKRKGDRIRRFHQVFDSTYSFSAWFESFFKTDQNGEVLEFNVWFED